MKFHEKIAAVVAFVGIVLSCEEEQKVKEE